MRAGTIVTLAFSTIFGGTASFAAAPPTKEELADRLSRSWLPKEEFERQGNGILARLRPAGAADAPRVRERWLAALHEALPYEEVVANTARHLAATMTEAELQELLDLALTPGKAPSTSTREKLARATQDARLDAVRLSNEVASTRLPALLEKYGIRRPAPSVNCPEGQSGFDELDNRDAEARNVGCADAEGRRQGAWRVTRGAQRISDDPYLDGVLHGLRIIQPLAPGEGIEEQTFDHGERHGPATQYDAGGVKLWTRMYEHGREVSTVVYDEDGAPSAANGLPKRVISYLIRLRHPFIRLCYERALNHNPSLAGKVVLDFFIEASGAVEEAKVLESTLKDEAVEACVLAEMRKLGGPPPRGGRLRVKYPFTFSAH